MSFVQDHPLVSLSSALVLLLIVRKIFRSMASSLKGLSGPGGAHWFWGHELMASERPSGDAYTEWIEACGQTFKIKGAMFHPDILVTVDPGAVSRIFTGYSYEKSSFMRTMIDRLTGKGLVYATGEMHKRQRYQLSPLFTTQATCEMFDAIVTCAQASVNLLASEISKSSDSAVLNIQKWTSRVTLDIIGRFAFDIELESVDNNISNLIQEAWDEQVRIMMNRSGLIGFYLLRACPWIVDLPIPAIQRDGAMKMKIRNLAEKVLQRGLSENKQKTLMTALITDGGLDARSEEINTIIIAGHETTAGSLAWVLYELAKKPEYQKRLRNEIMQLGEELTYEDFMERMPFLDAVMKEIFRHRPGSPHLERVAQRDDVLKLRNPVHNDCGHEITEIPVKAGQLIFVPTISITHQKSIWGPDAEEFNPDRWLDPSRIPSASLTCGAWNGLFIFSEGTRMCIGYKLAILEFKVILASYLRHFEFHDTGASISHRFAVTLQPYIVGKEDKGNQLPLRVSLIDLQTQM